MIGKSYIIRVYRFDKDLPESIVGTIEDVELGKREKFKGMSELWEKLKRSDDKDSDRKKANSP